MKYIDKGAELRRDVDDETTALGKLATKMASAGKTGRGIGGLLGGILGQILIPIPGVGAAIGAGLGGWAGTEAGEAISGVDEDDLRAGKFYKNTRNQIVDDIAGAKLSQSLEGGLKAGMTAGFSPGGGIYGKGANLFKDTMQYGVSDAFKHGMARSSIEGASEYGDLMAQNVTKEGLLDNPWLQEEDEFWDPDLLNPQLSNQVTKMPWETNQMMKMPWEVDEYLEETGYNPHGPFMQYQQ